MDEFEETIDAINVALDAADWGMVVLLTPTLYQEAVAVGDMDFAKLVEDLHCIAQDALVRPLVVAQVLGAMSRHEFFQACDADGEHQHLAGIASWRAFSARWRARQGLPLLNAMDVQYLTPGDFWNGKGRPLAPAEQRRRFRAYVEAAIAEEAARRVPAPLRRRPGLQSADLAFVRSSLPAADTFRPEMEYGRQDLPPWAEENLSLRRPYGIPIVEHEGAASQAYWLDPALAPETDEDW